MKQDHVYHPHRHRPDSHRAWESDPVHFEGEGIVRIRDRTVPVHADLVGGRDRHSVGGQIAEGPRWWRGRIDWSVDEVPPLDGGRLLVELDDGRCAPAIIAADPAVPEHSISIQGIGPPPFDVP